jgi:hypothetical protein
MKRIQTSMVAAALVLGSASMTFAQDESVKVQGGGVSIPGWTGKIDAKEAAAGMKLDNAKLVTMGSGMHVTTGPAVAYWNPANTASGDYTVKATFAEREYMALNNHPHPYGVFIAGSGMGTDTQRYLYCMAYGSGTFIVRGFGPEPFQVNGRRPEANEAINKAAAKGQPVTQEIALSVKGDKVECAINGKVVGSYDKSAVLGDGKLNATDGIYGIRFGHNTDAHVSGFTMTKP